MATTFSYQLASCPNQNGSRERVRQAFEAPAPHGLPSTEVLARGGACPQRNAPVPLGGPVSATLPPAREALRADTGSTNPRGRPSRRSAQAGG
jgi:hypothetical protein